MVKSEKLHSLLKPCLHPHLVEAGCDEAVRRLARMLCLLFVVMVLPCSCIEEDEFVEDVVSVGDVLPEFSVVMNDGRIVTGAMLCTSPSVVMFFHTSCPDCQQMLPRVQRLYDEYASRGVPFVLVSRDEESTFVFAYWTKNGLSMPYSAQTDSRVYELFARRGVPRIYVSDATGVVRHIFTDDPLATVEELFAAVADVLDAPN